MARGETVQVINRTVTGQDARGADLYQDDDPLDVPGAFVWPRGSTELVQHQDQVTQGLTVLVPAGTPVDATSRMCVRGELYEVDGAPADWRSGFTGRRPGLEVQLTRITG